MSLAHSIHKGISDHRQKIGSPHFLFSAEAPKYPEKNEVKMNHEQIISHLRGAGYDAHAVDGHYGGPERSIVVYGVSQEHAEKLHGLAARLGQDSSIYSTGSNHEMRFHHGKDAGKKVKGTGTVFHDSKPSDFYTSLPGGQHHFTHNFNFDETPDNSAAHAPKDNVTQLHPAAPEKKVVGKSELIKSEENSFTFRKMLKAEDPEAYKKLASKGIMVGFPATISGQHQRPDNGIEYHSTVKFFNPDADKPEDIHAIAANLGLKPPKPEETHIEPGMFKDRLGNDVYVIKLHGPHADAIKQHNKKFDHMGYPATFEYTPHVSVDKATWQKIVDSKAKTAHEAGIEFHPAELKQGPKTLATYHHNVVPMPQKKPGKIAASEPAMDNMQKGAIRNIATAAGAMAAVGSMAPAAIAPDAQRPPAQVQQNAYTSGKMLNAIQQVESSGGKNTNHDQLGGLHSGESAYGKYGLTPLTIRETIKLNPDLKQKHSRAAALKGDALHHYMQDNPELEEIVAARHLKRLEHHFGQDPKKIGYAWLNGITGTYKAGKQNTDLDGHWHVQKITQAFGKGM